MRATSTIISFVKTVDACRRNFLTGHLAVYDLS